MTDFQALILGFVQGFTEWLPISSTAHLRLVPALAGWPDPGAAFTAVSQLGTLLAALVYFRTDLIGIVSRKPAGGPAPGDTADRRLLLPILVGTLPIVVTGALLRHAIEHQFRSLYVVTGAMMGFAVLLWVAERARTPRRSIDTVTVADGLVVGFGQALALIPGASRSGTTITAALFAGLERAAAARFSFLLSLPAVFLAGAYELYKARHAIADSHMGRPLLLATVVAFLVGWATIHWLLHFLRRHPTYVFIVYRLLLGLAILGLLLSGRITATDAAHEPIAPPAAVRPARTR